MKYNQPYGVSDPNAVYVNGNPTTGTMGSIPPAESIEYPQREIVNLITDADRVGVNSDLRQLGKSVQGQLLVSKDDAGTSNQLQVTMKPAPGAYAKYMIVVCMIGNTNTGACTLNVNAMGPKNIVNVDGSALAAGTLRSTSIACFVYDGTNFQIAWITARAVGGEAINPGVPVYLTANYDYYVNGTTGSDTLYDGSSATIVAGTSRGPFKTIQKACDQVPRFNLNGWSVTIHVADGTYAGFRMLQYSGSGSCIIIGNTSNPNACIVNGAGMTAASFGILNGLYKIRGFKLTAVGPSNPGDPIACIVAAGNGLILYIGEMNFGQSLAGAIICHIGAVVSNEPQGCAWHVSGGGSGSFGPFTGNFLYSSGGANISYHSAAGPNITIDNAVNFVGGFAQSTSFGLIGLLYSSLANPGSVTGPRFYVHGLSLISVAGGGVNYFPGNVAGTIETSTGGYYI